ncbi:hypothetical protein OZX57_05150 [Bifidobacterium sp. ESL0682]|uniref:TPM domain-containing protein n=1 Tax=Bifidobacterium sp. ESL0682 TaxID=2983212 RepID=UPI0023F67077|nr:hypothetical protein [Bifidobacterium sp. ESL0682]WEV41431.1 hypothetical protein OZX57_05150 [Bifidobacterium sp. ESL0682]
MTGPGLFVVTGSREAAAATPAKVDISSDITDPQNLLGGDASHVNDEIAAVKEQTGVTVRLLYLANFTGTNDPDKWAAETLQSTNPPANTVLLAVASNDGRLVVAVSHNSDNWIKSKDHVAALSQAALGPIQKGDNPDWPGSACSMMDEIKTLHQQEASKRPKIIIGVCVGVGVIVLIAVAVALVIRRRKSSLGAHSVKSGSNRRHGKEKNNGMAAGGSGKSGKENAKGPKHRKKH